MLVGLLAVLAVPAGLAVRDFGAALARHGSYAPSRISSAVQDEEDGDGERDDRDMDGGMDGGMDGDMDGDMDGEVGWDGVSCDDPGEDADGLLMRSKLRGKPGNMKRGKKRQERERKFGLGLTKGLGLD